MECETFDRRHNDLLDRRVSPASDPWVREHVAYCARCRTILRVQGELNDVVQRLEMPVVEPVVVGNRRSPAAVMPALAALLLLGVAGWWFRHAQNEVFQSPSLVQSTATDEGASALGGQARPADPISQPSQTSMLAMHQPLLGLQLLSRADWSDTFSAVSTGLEIPGLKSKWMTVVANEMAPVQQSMASALNLLRRTLASSSEDETSIDG